MSDADSTPSSRPMIAFLLLMLLASSGTIFAVLTHSWEESVPVQPPPSPVDPSPVLPPDPQLIRQAFFDKQIRPKILVADRQNRDASARTIRKLHQQFDHYRRGITPLIDDLTSWSTRFSVLRRMPGDWWRETDRVRDMIQTKIESRLFSDKKLVADLNAIVNDFSNEVTANQTALIGDIKASVSAADLVGLPEPKYEDFAATVALQLQNKVTADATDSLRNGVLIELAGLAGGFAAEQLIAQIVVRVTAMAASTAAGAGGAAATSAAAGGGGGTLIGGPIGAAAGIAGGILVGLAIDWWASEKFEAKIQLQLQTALQQIERAITDDMQQSLDVACDSLAVSYASVLEQQIVTPENEI